VPLTKSAKKALRVDRTKKAINDITRNKVKSALKAARLAVAAGNADVKAKIDAAFRELDIAAKKNIIHKNRASRLKSRLSKKLAKFATNPVIKKPRPKADQPMAEVKKPATKKTVAKQK